MKRIILLIVTNFAVLAVLSVTMQLLGIDRMLAQDTGLNLTGLLIMAALFGFGVGVAVERGQGWLLLKRATPMPPLAYLLAKMATAVAFGLAGPVRTLPPGIQFLSTGGGRALRFDRLGRMCKPTSGNTACPDVTSGVPGSGTYWDATQATITVTVQKTLETNVTRTVQIQPAGVVRLQQ